jgi:hypothetical protein
VKPLGYGSGRLKMYVSPPANQKYAGRETARADAKPAWFGRGSIKLIKTRVKLYLITIINRRVL